MEYVDGGDLLTFVRGKKKLVEEDARLYFEQIVSVLDYLHQRRIVHRYAERHFRSLYRLIVSASIKFRLLIRNNLVYQVHFKG